jgi:hypothetical protein
MPLNNVKMLIVLRAQTPGGQNREVNVTYDVPPEGTPQAGLNLSAAQKTKLEARLQQMALILDENDTVL